MGLFDSVLAPCPHCGNRIEFQSKEGECCMNVYNIDAAPTEVLTDVLNDPAYCRHCEKWSALYDPTFPPNAQPPRPNPRMVKLREPEKQYIHPHQSFLRWWESAFSEEDIVSDD
jgi:hypothetical protein